MKPLSRVVVERFQSRVCQVEVRRRIRASLRGVSSLAYTDKCGVSMEDVSFLRQLDNSVFHFCMFSLKISWNSWAAKPRHYLEANRSPKYFQLLNFLLGPIRHQ